MKDAKGHGSDGKGGAMPLRGHPYHLKSNSELHYISKDAHAAATASRGMSSYDPNGSKRQDTDGKYLDQVNDAATVLGYRARGGEDLSHAARRADGLARAAGEQDSARRESMAREARDTRVGHDFEKTWKPVIDKARAGGRQLSDNLPLAVLQHKGFAPVRGE
jgi:hypothetical protein